MDMCVYCSLDTAGNHRSNCPVTNVFERTQIISTPNVSVAVQGWLCPTCQRVYAPHISMCGSCGPKQISTDTTNNQSWAEKNYAVTIPKEKRKLAAVVGNGKIHIFSDEDLEVLFENRDGLYIETVLADPYGLRERFAEAYRLSG